MSFKVGNPVKVEGTFYVLGTPTDPDTVNLQIKDPAGNVTEPSVTRVGPGVYATTITPQIVGTWKCKFTGTGDAASVDSASFDIAPQAF